MTKSFLEKLGANDNMMAEKVIDEEFIVGVKPGPNGTPKRTSDEIQMLETIKQRLRENYKWNERTNVDLLAAQKCSDMIVEICKFLNVPKLLLTSDNNLKSIALMSILYQSI